MFGGYLSRRSSIMKDHVFAFVFKIIPLSKQLLIKTKTDLNVTHLNKQDEALKKRFDI